MKAYELVMHSCRT